MPAGFHPVQPLESPSLGVGVFGYGFMGKAHTNGFRKLPYIFWPPPAVPRLVARSPGGMNRPSKRRPSATGTRGTISIGGRWSQAGGYSS